MIGNTTANRATSGLSSPVAAVVKALAANGPDPDLDGLAQALVGSLSQWDGVEHLALAFEPEWAAQLDRRWSRRRDFCLVAEPQSTPRWVALPGGWQPLIAAIGPDRDVVYSTVGPVPGGAPWRVTRGFGSAARNDAWALMPITALGHTVAVALLATAPDGDAPDISAWAATLREVGGALSLVTELWGRQVSLVADLARARDERHSLSRLNRLQGRFVAMASHEFKTPLTSITAYTDVLRAQLTDEQFPHAREFLDVVKTEANRLLRMVNRIVDFTRMEYGSELLTRQPTDLEPLVAETVRGLQPIIEDKELAVSIRAEAGLPRAEIDPDLIRQVLVNLVGNAVKYTPPGGAITITITELESVVAVTVADNGPGIPEDAVRKVFREFYRADGSTATEEGTGLGLTIARHIINLHGGHIDARRRASGGSEFRFLVPKETGSVPDLPAGLAPAEQAAAAHDLVNELLRLMAELTGSRAVTLLLRDGKGALMPAGAMGWESIAGPLRPIIENEVWIRFLQAGKAVCGPGRIPSELAGRLGETETGRLMCAPLGSGDTVLGAVVTGRRRLQGPYEDADLAQLNILADVAKAALYSMHTSVGRTAEAVRLLLRIRRTGVPTSTSQALDLLARLAQRLGVGESGTRRLQYAAALHDAGMGRVEEEIVLGDATLDVDQRDEVDRHVEQGVDLMAPLLPDAATTDIIRYHHERFDGSGYPEGLAGENIPLGSRLLAVIDAWFSLTRPRPFRGGLPPEAALAEIDTHSGTQFDPRVVREFHAVLIECHIVAETAAGPDPAES